MSSNLSIASCEITVIFFTNFAKLVAQLQNLLNEEGFCWTHMHQKTFDDILKKMFSDNLFLSYFDITLPPYIFTDVLKLDLVLFYTKEKILKT